MVGHQADITVVYENAGWWAAIPEYLHKPFATFPRDDLPTRTSVDATLYPNHLANHIAHAECWGADNSLARTCETMLELKLRRMEIGISKFDVRWSIVFFCLQI